jgi:hypothetical protein
MDKPTAVPEPVVAQSRGSPRLQIRPIQNAKKKGGSAGSIGSSRLNQSFGTDR